MLESKDYDHAELLSCTVSSSLDLESMAGIKIRLGDQVFTGSGAGNGGFDAFTNALGRILKRQGLGLPPLIDYEIRIPKGGRTDALTECSITWQTERGELRTRGVHANQVFAAIGATMRMLNIQMHRAPAESRREGEA
ncbi:MAG: hypothetical protein MZV65_07590 [Chromatiales bacterium]|nr:hypothetical protein [Chromatiales bacterium]